MLLILTVVCRLLFLFMGMNWNLLMFFFFNFHCSSKVLMWLMALYVARTHQFGLKAWGVIWVMSSAYAMMVMCASTLLGGG